MSFQPIIPRDFVSSTFSLDGRVAAIAGGGSGLGAAIAAGLSQAGARIAVLDIDATAASSTAKAIVSEGGEAFSLACDVTDSGSLASTVAAIVDRTGGVDVLVNSAGTAFRSPAEDFPESELDRVLNLNLKGTYLPCQAFGRRMLEQEAGSIINLASIGGLIAYPYASAYLASKGGVVQLTRGLALEWIGKVRVNAIAPCLFDTPMTSKGARRTTTTSDFIAARALRPGLAKPQEVVGAAVFLASDASRLVTGHTLPVDDGYLIA
jgi:NAD(P)-dependent dehydrogenase (short-subunit alcohol dehydrogenase family)